jgi:hypothetical protein
MGTKQELHLADNDPWLLWASHGTYSVQITVPLVEFIRNRAVGSDVPNPEPPHTGWDRIRSEVTIPDDHVLAVEVEEPAEGKSSFDAKVTFTWDTEADCAVYPWCGLDYACLVRNSVAQTD